MRKLYVLFIIGIIWLPGIVKGDVGTGANFLKIGVGPRPVGLGSAFTGVADDIYAIYWNPAGLGFIRNWEFSFMADRYLADTYLGSLAGAKQFRFLGSRKFTVGGSILHLGMPDWDSMENRESTDPDQPVGSASNTAYSLSLAQRLDWLRIPYIEKQLSLGLNIKWLRSTLIGESASTFAVDLGASYQMDLWNRPFSFGLTAQNIGKPLKYIQEGSPLPLSYRGGISYKFGSCTPHQLLFASDLAYYRGSDLKLGFGAEYWFRNRLALRGGYLFNSDDLGDLSFGMSYRFGLSHSGTQIHATYQDYDALKNTLSGAYTLHAIGPDPFRLIYPENNQPFCWGTPIPCKWEDAPGGSACDQIRYQFLADADSAHLAQMIRVLKSNILDTINVAKTVTTTQLTTTIMLTELPDSSCYWTVIAIDQEQHVRQAEQIRKLIIRKPDITIPQIAIVSNVRRSDLLVDFKDKVENRLEVIVKNSAACEAVNFSIILKDSLFCPLDFNQFHQTFEQEIVVIKVDTLAANSMDTFYIDWIILQEGLHQVYAKADHRDNVNELNELNNEYKLLATTGSKGMIGIAGIENIPWRDEFYQRQNTDAEIVLPDIHLVKSVSEYCDIPIVPHVFFNLLSSEVLDNFYKEKVDRPFPILMELANRMKKYPNFQLNITGYVDYNIENRTEQENKKLAEARAEATKSILVENFGVDPFRIRIKTPSDSTTAKKIQAISIASEISPIDANMINEENRRVDFSAEDLNGMTQALFFPQNKEVRPYFVTPIIYHSKIKAPDGCSGWQLEIIKEPMEIPVITLPFQIDNSHEIMKDSLNWFGTDHLGNLVELNQNYSFRVNFANTKGELQHSNWKTFRIVADTIANNRFVHLMKFNKNEPVYEFFSERIQAIASQFVDAVLILPDGVEKDFAVIDSTVHSYVLGFTCVIGREDRLHELANNERTLAILDIFQLAIKADLIKKNLYREELFNNMIKQIDGTAHLEPRKYVRTSLARQWYKEPFSVLQPCCHEEIIYGTETPEGRNYNRRVEIVIWQELNEAQTKQRALSDK